MDLQKEREAFEKWAENNGYHIEKKDGNYVVTSTIHCWLAWQAKAQAVPEGFVLVPKEPTSEVLKAISAEIIKPNNGRIFLAKVYKAMIEAQEPANDSR